MPACSSSQKSVFFLILHSCTSSVQYVMDRPLLNPMNTKDGRQTKNSAENNLKVGLTDEDKQEAPSSSWCWCTRSKLIGYISTQLCVGSPVPSYPVPLWVPHRKSHHQPGSVAKSLQTSKGSSPLDGLESTADMKQQSTMETGVNFREQQSQNCLIVEQMRYKKGCN